MRISYKYATHLPVLIKLMAMTKGPVLELGMGVFSTPFLHWACYPKRKLVSYDNEEKYYHMFITYQSEWHKLRLVSNWNTAKIKRKWDIALIDHSPNVRRKEEVRRLRNYAKYLVVHDTQAVQDWEYKYSEVFPLFKYRYDFKATRFHTSVLSNIVDLKDLWI